MAKLIATERGYFGGRIVDIGESFTVDDDLWRDERRRPSWAKLDPRAIFGGKGDHDGDGSVGGSKPREPESSALAGPQAALVIPADWRSQPAKARRDLAKAIIGEDVPNAAEADKVISNYVESTKPEAFGDAPAPETAGNGLVEALGGPQPDWVAPSQVD